MQTKAKMNHALSRGAASDFGMESMFEKSRCAIFEHLTSTRSSVLKATGKFGRRRRASNEFYLRYSQWNLYRRESSQISTEGMYITRCVGNQLTPIRRTPLPTRVRQRPLRHPPKSTMSSSLVIHQINTVSPPSTSSQSETPQIRIQTCKSRIVSG